MILTLILIVVSVVLIFLIISLDGKLKDGRRRIAEGERQVEAGRRKLEKYDNWFVQTFFNKKLQAGKRQLSSGINQLNAGKSKLSLGETVKVILIILCAACVIWAIIRIVKSVIA